MAGMEASTSTKSRACRRIGGTLAPFPPQELMCRQELGDRWREPFILPAHCRGSPHHPISPHLRFAAIGSLSPLVKREALSCPSDGSRCHRSCDQGGP